METYLKAADGQYDVDIDALEQSDAGTGLEHSRVAERIAGYAKGLLFEGALELVAEESGGVTALGGAHDDETRKAAAPECEGVFVLLVIRNSCAFALLKRTPVNSILQSSFAPGGPNETNNQRKTGDISITVQPIGMFRLANDLRKMRTNLRL